LSLEHAFSIDVEGFYESNEESFAIDSKRIRDQREKDEIAANIDEILEFLDGFGIQGTFFVLGIIAKEQPNVIEKIATAGHEIGSHGFTHRRLFNLSKKEAILQLELSKKYLEDVSGQRVIGFRAPEYSIIEKNEFLLDELKRLGYLYDSSLYPINGHDVYGIRDCNPNIHKRGNGLIEFPPSVVSFLGKQWPVLSGGYFRLCPLPLTKLVLKTLTKQVKPGMIVLHPYEIGSHYPINNTISAYRKFRHYVNITKGKSRLIELFKTYQFAPISKILGTKFSDDLSIWP